MDPFVDMCNGRSVIITHILLWYFRQATNVEIIAAIFNEYKIITSFRCSLLLNDLFQSAVELL